LAEAFDLKGVSGVVVSEVQEGSAAEKAGIEQGDVLTKLDGKTLKSSAQLRNAVGVRKVGAPVELTLIRDGKEKVIKAKIGEPSGEQIASTGIRKYLDGARLAPSRDPKGVLVESLEPGSTAQIAGLRVGDIITSVNKARVESLNDLKKATQKDGSQLLIRVLRGNAALYLVLR